MANAGYSNIPWMGVNEYGFAILNSLTYDLTGGSGPGNGTVMRYALGNCVTIDDFQDYLDSTNITGRNTRANFAVIDSNSNAAIFEVGGNEYWKFNAEDEPDGYIIRTNFTVNGSGSTGIQRYNRSSALISDFYAGDSLNYRSLLRHQMRDFSDYNSQPYPVPLLEKLYPWANWGYFPTNYALCNNISVSASVIQGILPGEKPELSSMWTMLGNPAASIAVPYWPVGDPPDKANGSPTAPLCDLANEVREVMYDDYDMPDWINSHKLLDTLGGGIWTFTFPREDMILDSTEMLLNNWRGLDSIPVNAMLDVEDYFAEMAYSSLDSVFGIYVGFEPLAANNAFRIYPNPAHDYFSIEQQQGVEANSLEIINMQGKTVSHQNIRDQNRRINTGSFPAGFYVIRIYTNKDVETKKLIIQ